MTSQMQIKMKKFSKIQAIVFGLICMISGNYAFAQGNQGMKSYNEEFPVGEATRLVVDNSYGNVNITNHSAATIVIEVVVRVDVRDRDRAQSILDNIDINLYQEGDVVYAKTELGDSFSRLFRGTTGVEINYTLKMPASVPVNLTNKYGNVFIEELTSTSTIDVKYGKLNANRIIHDSKEPLTKIILSYSDGVIQETSWLNADIKYAKLTITNSRALVVISKYSKVYVTNGSSIVSESKYDSFEIGTLNNFVINTSYSNIKIAKLSGRFQAETKYTDVNVTNITSAFESIRVKNGYGNYRLGIAPDASYRLDGSSKYSDIIYPQGSKVSRISQNNSLQVKGIVGHDQNPSAVVSISSDYGNVRLTP